jgi:hypothetical protein
MEVGKIEAVKEVVADNSIAYLNYSNQFTNEIDFCYL